MSRLSWPATIYISALGLLALGLTIVNLAPLVVPTVDKLVLAAICAGLMTVTWLRPLPRGPKRKLYLDDSVLIATVLLLKPGAAIMVAGAGTLIAHAIRLEDRVQTVFNVSQIMLKAGVGAAILVAFGVGLDGELASGLEAVGPIIVAGLAMFVANYLMVATMIALHEGESVLHVWYQTARELNHVELVEFLVQVAVGIVVAMFTTAAPWALLPLLLPAGLVYKVLEGSQRRMSRAGGVTANKAERNTQPQQRTSVDGTAHGAS